MPDPHAPYISNQSHWPTFLPLIVGVYHSMLTRCKNYPGS